MDRVAGIQTGGSEKAFDLFMKCGYLHDLHAGRGVTFATGTPVSNTMVELYTMQRYLDPDGLRARGIEHFDAWAATFGEVVEAMEISPDGKTFRPRSRFAKFVNLPELQQMFRQFADVQTADMLNLPRPALAGGKPRVVACPMSDEQRVLQDGLVARYERVRNGGVDPREDNALAITTDGRKLALDSRMLSGATDFPGSKINALVETVHRIWTQTTQRRGTQMVFCDMGVHANPFSAYDEVVGKLVRRGIPAEQIAAVGEADTDAKKQALFDKVRSGSVRVLLGSTAKLGTGTNVQERLAALHHLDAPWKPAEVEQRDGRILRQGNENPEVAIYRYVTEGSFDAYMWQALETKAKFINQIMTGESGVRRAEDVAGQELSFAEVKAIASGNPAVLVLAEADAEAQRLCVLRRSHADEQYLARKNLRELPERIERLQRRLAGLTADQATLRTSDGYEVNGKPGSEAALSRALTMIPDRVDWPRMYPVGVYKGMAFGIERHPGGAADVYLEGTVIRKAMLSRESQGVRAVMNALGRLEGSYIEACEEVGRELGITRNQLVDYEARLGRVFPHATYLDELAALRNRLQVALAVHAQEGESPAELAEKIKTLRAAHVPIAAVKESQPAPLPVPAPPDPPAIPDPVPSTPSPVVSESSTSRRSGRGGQMTLF